MRFTLEQIKKVFSQKGHEFFDSLNIIGVRSSSTQANVFDDWLYLTYRDGNGIMKTHEFSITTDPGAYWLQNPINVNGTSILVPGQYKNSHTVGLHQGKYEALKQQNPVKVWRDNTRDLTLDKEGQIFEGIFGINIHRSSATSESQTVDRWSAGCQVFKKVADFNFFMDICRKSSQKNFTYTLLEEGDFGGSPGPNSKPNPRSNSKPNINLNMDFSL